MTLLSSADLTAMRGVLNESLPETAVIQTRTFTSDAGGGGTAAWTAAGTVDARIASLGASEEVTGSRLAPEADSIVTLPANTTVTEDNRIVISGITYEVEAVPPLRSYELSRRVEVSEVV